MSRVEIYRESFAAVQLADGTLQLSATKRGKWRWRFISNGHVMADSGQGYSRRIDCLNGCATVLGGKSYLTTLGRESIWRASAADDYRGGYIEVRDLTKAVS